MTPHLTDTPVLETKRLKLRAPKPQDADAFMAFYRTDRAKYVGGPMASRQAWSFFCTEIGHWSLNGFGMFTVTSKDDDRALGIVGHWYPHGWPEREVGWVLFEGEGTGIAAEAARRCIMHAYDALGWDTAVSYIDPENARSIALAERLGASLDRNARAPTAMDPDATAPLVYRHPRRAA